MSAEEAKAYGLVDEVVKSRKELKLPESSSEPAVLTEGAAPIPQTQS
jgi:enoyl-CoA hydratase/carnithine racemase